MVGGRSAQTERDAAGPYRGRDLSRAADQSTMERLVDPSVSRDAPLDGADVLPRWNRNLAAYVELLADAAAGGEWVEADGAVLFAGAHAYPGTHTNGVLRLSDELPAADLLARADAFFAPRRRSYTVWVRDAWDADLEAALRDRGFQLHPPEHGMPAFATARPFREADHPVPPESTMRRVEEARSAVDFLTVTGKAFGMDVAPKVLAQIFFHPKTLLDPRVEAFVGYLGDTPVACCLTFTEHDFAGIYSAAAVPAARGRGLARATIRAAANAGLARGASYTGGTSSDAGAPLWVRMGCEVFAHWRRWYGRPSGAP
jgi:hypothetical protein